MVEIKAGVRYLTAGGFMVGPIEDNEHEDWPWRNPTGAHPEHEYINWNVDGSKATLDGFTTRPAGPEFAIVAEWTDGPWDAELLAENSPVRTITSKVIVPGVYGSVIVGGVTTDKMAVSLKMGMGHYDAASLIATAKILTSLAEALIQMGEKP